MRRVDVRDWLPGPRFAAWAVACAVPVVLLGLILAGTFGSTAQRVAGAPRPTPPSHMSMARRDVVASSGMEGRMQALRDTAASVGRRDAELQRAFEHDLMYGLGALYLILVTLTAWGSVRLRREAARNARLANHDALTGLPNRTSFARAAGEALEEARRSGRTAAIARIGLDRFRHVNDALGHRNGDAFLCEIADRLGAELGGSAFVARLGGDEYGLILADGERAAPTLRQVRVALEAEIEVAGLALHAPASIGYVLAPQDGADVDTLLARADVAMYAAKDGHHGVTRYDSSLESYDAASLGLAAQLRHAIEDDQLVLHYQPQLALAGDRIVALEALVRWQHPVHGLLFPDRFLGLAEQTDDIERLTAWVLRRALSDVDALAVAGTRPRVAVNVSARSLGRGELAETVLGILGELGIEPDRLIVEVTETAILVDPARAGRELARLAHAGVRVSLDDFGRGQTSIAHLSALPLQELKIDRSFVGDMDRDPTHAAIVRSLIELGHNLGLQVVAEGVETDAVRRQLHDAGAEIEQGYLLSRPLALGDVVAWLHARTPPAADIAAQGVTAKTTVAR